jgi:hypothetical protein
MPITLPRKKPRVAAHDADHEKQSPSASGKTAGLLSKTDKISAPSPSHPIAADEHVGRIHSRLDRQKAAEFLTAHGYKITANRLAKLAASKEGPEYRRWGKSVYYYPEDLLKWAEAREEVVLPHGGASHQQ